MTKAIDEFIGVYDADSTLWGEVSYWIGARLGRTHCSLCDITHGTFRMKKEWRECASQLGIPFTTYHRNDAPPNVLATCNESFPIVLAREGDDLSVVLTNEELDTFNGSVSLLQQRLSEILA